MKILMAHPTGNSNVRAVISALDHAEMLAEFNTTIAFNAEAKWLNSLPDNLKGQLLRRRFSMSPNLIKAHPFTELARLILPKIGLNRYIQKEESFASIDAVYQNLDKAVAKRLSLITNKHQITAVYGYEDGVLNTFKRAKELGITCIYDLPIAYWETSRKLLQEEALRLPAWAETLGGGITDSAEKLDRKTQEMKLADVVVTPGAFVVNSIPDWAKKKHLIVSPFGSPCTKLTVKHQLGSKNRKLKVLFVGSMTQRKGLADLFEAVKLLNSPYIELIVMGSAISSLDFYRTQLPTFTYLSSRPHHEVLELMRSCDVFCLPSIVEGRALVMQEAMSQGLPLIITANTGGEDLVKEGQTGFMVPIRSAESIASKLQWFLDNKFRIAEMGHLAQIHSKQYSWESYGINIVSSLLAHKR